MGAQVILILRLHLLKKVEPILDLKQDSYQNKKPNDDNMILVNLVDLRVK